MRILVLGAGGMLGHTMFRRLGANSAWQVYGTLRSDGAKRFFPAEMGARLLTGVDVEHHDTLVQAFVHTRPDTVINCVGLIKQLAAAQDPLKTIPVNALLPHRLAGLCQLAGARLVHVSTDCVFSGKKGNYRETDPADASDLYGRSKLLGEVIYPHTITLRTSMIGHELAGTHGLLGWFLAQQGRIKGYTRAVFSGLPTVELARVVRDVVLPRPELSGLYHVAGAPIAKYDLLKLVAEVYRKEIEIIPDDRLAIDRSLDAQRFREATGYVAPPWRQLIESMHAFQKDVENQCSQTTS